MSEDRFDRALRAMLLERAPDEVPDELRARVADVIGGTGAGASEATGGPIRSASAGPAPRRRARPVARRIPSRLTSIAAGIVALAVVGGTLLALAGLHGSIVGPAPTASPSPLPSGAPPSGVRVVDTSWAFDDITWSPDGSSFAALAETEAGKAEVRVYSSSGKLLARESGDGYGWLDAPHVAIQTGQFPDTAPHPVVLLDVRTGSRQTLAGDWLAVSGSGHGTLALLRPGGASFVLWRPGFESAAIDGQIASYWNTGAPDPWSPDGSHLAYWLPTTSADASGGTDPGGIVLASIGGPATPTVLAVLDAASGRQEAAFASTPLDPRAFASWSRDGSWLAGASATGAGRVLLPAPGGASSAVQSLPAPLQPLGWTQDGELAVGNSTGAVGTWDPRSSGGVLRASLPAGARTVASPCGGSLTLDAAGNLLVESRRNPVGDPYLTGGIDIGGVSLDHALLACGRVTSQVAGGPTDLVLAPVKDLAAAADPPALVAPSPSPTATPTASGWPVALPGPLGGAEDPFVVGSDGTVYLATAPWGSSGQGEVLAVGPDGAKPGWPFAPAGIAAFDRPVPGPNGTVYVNGWRYGNGTQSTNDAAVWALDAAGQVLPGWPVDVPGGAQGMAVAPDGTAYFIERASSGGAQAVALDASGHVKPGWPVVLTGGLACGGVNCGPVGDLVAADGTYYVQVATSTASGAPIELVALSADGSVRAGWPVRVPGEGFALGSDGNVYAWGVENSAPAAKYLPPLHILRATYTILGLDGRPLPGWPVTIQGPSSPPAIAPDGSILVAIGGEPGQAERVEAIGTDGRVQAGWPYTLPSGVEAWGYGIGEGNPPRLSAPWLGSDGTAYLAVHRTGATQSDGIIALGSNGAVRSGWPLWLPADTQFQLANMSVGGGGNLRGPAFASDGTIHVAVTRGRRGAVLGLAPNGTERVGWPFVTSSQSEFVVGLLVAPDETLYVATTSRLYAVRPEGRPAS